METMGRTGFVVLLIAIVSEINDRIQCDTIQGAFADEPVEQTFIEPIGHAIVDDARHGCFGYSIRLS